MLTIKLKPTDLATGGYKYGYLALQVRGVSNMRQLNMSLVRMTALERTSSNCKRETHPLGREDYDRMCSVKKNAGRESQGT
jgi:hypothetical protein